MNQKLLIALLFLSVLGIKAQTINFSDPVFKNKIKAWGTVRDSNGSPFVLDADGDGEVQVSEALNVYEIFADGASGGNIFANAQGIEYFTNLKKLTIKFNNQITGLDLSALTQLEYLNTYLCSNLSTLNVSGLSQLKTLDCSSCALTQFAVNDLTALETLNCATNKLVNFNISGLQHLTTITGAGLSSGAPAPRTLTLSNLPALTSLTCNASGLNELNLSGVDNLTSVDCRFNNFTVLDFSMLYSADFIQAQNNYLLEYLFVKNGRNETVYFGNNQSTNALRYVCADEDQLSDIQYSINIGGYTQCHTSSYCSFTPGGLTYHTITGSHTYDTNNNGCDLSDTAVFPNFKVNLQNGSASSFYVADASGAYSFYPQDGNYNLVPVIEHPGYFNVTPSAVAIQFPQQNSPVQQSFCVTPNGIHHDVEAQIIPLNPARPGFDVRYVIVYQNKGNQIESGTISYAFNDAVLDLLSANPSTNTQVINYLNWNFTDLQPFETRRILVDFNLNSPLETPPVNSGSILDFTLSVNTTQTDEMPEDNTFVLHQTVVNSFDPNDKTCLEGNTIPLDKVGDYLHYLIRFENTGTAPAQHIVVKDVIDASKFDVSSLIPTIGSHPFFTKISNGNKVEFIFENIQLPFDDAHNDGYVAFKIKTKADLVLGNTLSNSANIYFDYNAPIITNTATTTVSNALANTAFEVDAWVAIAPNPVQDVFEIQMNENIQLQSWKIYNTLGQLLMSGDSSQKSMDVSALDTGTYLIKITSAAGTLTKTFIKQ